MRIREGGVLRSLAQLPILLLLPRPAAPARSIRDRSMGNFLDSILGGLNSGENGGFPTDRMISTAPSGGNLPEDQVSTPSAKTVMALLAGGNRAEDTEINQALKLQPIKQKAPVVDEATRRAAQADRDGTLGQARAAVVRDPSKRAAIIARLRPLGIAV
jgi:hypothetical protein